MINKAVVAAVIAVVVLITLVIVYFTAPGKLVATVASDSPFKEGVKMTVRRGETSQVHDLPTTLALKAGRYDLVFAADDPNALAVRRRVRVWPGFTTRVAAVLEENDLPGVYDQQATPYLEHFPYETNDFILEAETVTEPQPKIVKIKLTVLHRFAGPDDPDLYRQEHDLAVNAAKQYLKEKGVPDDIPIEISDR